MNKSLVPLFVVGLLIILVGCTNPTFNRPGDDPVVTTERMEAELIRIHQINLTVGSGDFDVSEYPKFLGVDGRNGRLLVEKFICWDVCPDVGAVFLLYENVETKFDCESMPGAPLISPEPDPGQYWGCRPIVDWLDASLDKSG